MASSFRNWIPSISKTTSQVVWTLTSLHSEPSDPQRISTFLLLHRWRGSPLPSNQVFTHLEAQTSECCLLISAQHSTQCPPLIKMIFWILAPLACVPHWPATGYWTSSDSFNCHSHLLRSSAQHQSSSGLSTQPPPWLQPLIWRVLCCEFSGRHHSHRLDIKQWWLFMLAVNQQSCRFVHRDQLTAQCQLNQGAHHLF